MLTDRNGSLPLLTHAMVIVPVAIFVAPCVIRQTYLIVFSPMAATRINTSNSSSKRSGR